MSGSLNGSNQTVTIASGGSINVSGSSDTVDMLGGGYVGLISGNNDGVIMTGGTLLTANSISNLLLAGSNDIVSTGASNRFNVSGSNDVISMGSLGYVGVLGGNNDDINMTSGTLITAGTVTNLLLNGSNNTVSTGADNSVNISGSNDLITMGSLGYVGVVAGNNDVVDMSGGTLITAGTVTNLLLNGSNNVVATGGSNSIDVDGSNNVISMGSVGYDGLVAGNGDVVDMSGGTLLTAAGLTNVLVNGSSDIISTGADNSINIDGGNDVINMGSMGYVGLVAGNNDVLNMSGGTLEVVSLVSNLTLNGSNDIVGTGINISLDVEGNGDVITAGSSSTVLIEAGSGDSVTMTDGNLMIAANVLNTYVYQSDDVISIGANSNMSVNGSNDAITSTGTKSTVFIDSGDDDTVNMNNGTLSTGTGVQSLGLNGSNDIVNIGPDGSFSFLGNDDNVNVAVDDFVGITGGAVETVSLSGGTLSAVAGLVQALMVGSSDVAAIGTGSSLNVTGNVDTINASFGSTVTLQADDSGDTIHMYGGTIVLGAGLNNITIVGTGDTLSGTDASLAGPVYTTVTEHTGAGGALIFQTVTTTPAIVYDAGDIQDLLNYFEENPYLSENQILSLESESDYTSNLDNFLTNANLYGSTLSLPPSILAMLDGYSAVYMALSGVSPNVLAADTYIDQQVGWAAENYPMPATIQVSGNTLSIESLLQNLMPALESNNSNTQSLVSEAIELLEQGKSAAAAGSQTPMLNDATAEMLLGIAESPGYSASTQASAEVYTPDRSAHWQIIVNGDGTYTQTAKSAPLIQTVLSDFDNYVAPVIDIVAVLCLNPEFIAVTGLSSAVTTGAEVAADAVNLVQAGQDFAVGANLQGIFGVLDTVGGVLQQVGAAEGLPIGVCSTTNGLQQLGESISEGTVIAQGIDGLASGGNVLSSLDNALGGLSGVAGLAGDTPVQQYAAIGEALASTAQSAGSDNILSALDALMQAASTSGVLNGIIASANSLLQEFGSMWDGFQQQSLGVAAGAALDTNSNYSTQALTLTPYQTPGQNLVSLPAGATWGPNSYSILYNANGTPVGISYYDPSDTADNGALIACIDANALSDGVNGQQMQFIVAGHGTSTGIGSTPVSTTSISPEATLATMEQAGYVPGQNILIFACNAGSPNTTQGTVLQYVPGPGGSAGGLMPVPANINGNPTGSDFAQTLANLAHSSDVMAALGYIEGHPDGAYFTTLTDLPNNVTTLDPGSIGLYSTPATATVSGSSVSINLTPGKMLQFGWNNH